MKTELAQPAADYERRSLWLALLTGLIISLRADQPGFAVFGGGPDKLQMWLYMASLVALALSLVLSVALLVPNARNRLGRRFREGQYTFGWVLALFLVGLLITAAAGVETAADILTGDTPFGR